MVLLADEAMLEAGPRAKEDTVFRIVRIRGARPSPWTVWAEVPPWAKHHQLLLVKLGKGQPGDSVMWHSLDRNSPKATADLWLEDSAVDYYHYRWHCYYLCFGLPDVYDFQDSFSMLNRTEFPFKQDSVSWPHNSVLLCRDVDRQRCRHLKFCFLFVFTSYSVLDYIFLNEPKGQTTQIIYKKWIAK